MKSTGPLFLSLALAGGALAAETAHERGQRVVNEALQAVGGKAYLAMEDRVESGRAYSFYRQQLEGLSLAKIYTRYVTPVPGKPSVRERQSFGKDESSGVLFNQEGAWEINFHGARLLEPKRIENWRDGTLRNVFYTVRQVLKRRNPDYKDFDTEETLFARYRDAGGGVMWPLSIRRQRNGDKIYEINSESVQINRNLRDDLFTLPAKLKILPPAK